MSCAFYSFFLFFFFNDTATTEIYTLSLHDALPIADGLRALVERNPEATLIIAHAGIADLDALARCMAGRRGVFFDTSTWSPIDLLDFYRRVPPEQVVYASDFPYGQQPSSLFIALKTAKLAGYSDAQLRGM